MFLNRLDVISVCIVLARMVYIISIDHVWLIHTNIDLIHLLPIAVICNIISKYDNSIIFHIIE